MQVMYNAADIAELLRGVAPGYGFEYSTPKFSFAHLKEKRDKYIERLNGIYARLCDNVGYVRVALSFGACESGVNTYEPPSPPLVFTCFTKFAALYWCVHNAR